MNRLFPPETRFVKVFFYGLSLSLGLLVYLRMKWSYPDITWLSSYWIINDIDNLMSHNFRNVIWFEWASSEWSLNGWRWFEYLNAYFFEWNMALELFFYVVIILGIIFLVGQSIFNEPLKFSKTLTSLMFLMIFTLLSFSGAGARGMELGTYFGIFFTFLLFKIAFSEKKYKIVSGVLPPVVIFVFFGGYALSLTAVLVLMNFVVLRRLSNSKSFPNLRIATLSCVVSLGLFLSMFLSKKSQGPSVIKIFFEYIQLDYLYPFKFLFYSPLGGLITSQNIETLTPKEVSILVNGFGFFLSILFLFCIFYSYFFLRIEMLVPLALLLYSIGTSITIMVTRPSGDLGMLSPWYSLHLKLGIVGCLWLLIVFKSNSHLTLFGLNMFRSGTVFFLVIILLFANYTQWKRQPYERMYYQGIQKATLFPETMTTDINGLTALAIGLEESKRAIDVLKKHKIGIYRDPVQSKRQLFSNASYLPLGDAFADGWVGPNPRFIFQENTCKLIKFQFVNPPKIFQNQVNLILDGVPKETFEISDTPYSLEIKDAINVSLVEFKFSKSLIPAENGLGPDSRMLSARADVKCEK